MTRVTTYHGSFWDQGEEFKSPSISWSDLEAIFVSNGHEVAKEFTRYHGSETEEGTAFVIMKGTTTLNRPFVYDPATASGPWVEVSEDEDEYHIASDREELFAALRRHGHRACVVKDNYPEGDDIALFDDEAFEVEAYSLSFDGKTWSDWMDYETALEIMEKGPEKDRQEEVTFSP